ncbi:MAG: ECF transporter S component [Ruminococcus sp.]
MNRKEEVKNKKSIFTTRNLVTCAMLSACSAILMLIEFPLPFIAPSFYKLDLSEIPALIGAFSMGPLAGIIIELVKILINFVINGTDTAGVGELSNLILGCIFVVTASLVYRKKKTKAMALLSLTIGGVTMSVMATFINAFFIIPFYSTMLSLPIDTIVAMGGEIFPVVDSLFDFCLICVLPFNLIKSTIVILVTMLIYKPLSRLIKGKA